MLTGNILLVTRSERITEINIDGIIGLSENPQTENPSEQTNTYATFQRQLEAIRNISTPEIIVNIRSSGGNVNDALLIHDILCESGKKITTRCYGYVASAATLIAQAASKGLREMSANGLYLIHRSVTNGNGNVDALAQTVEMLNQTDLRIASLYANRAGKSVEHFSQLMSLNHGNGKWLSAHEAKKAGLIDRIIPAQTISNETRHAIQTLHLPDLPNPAENEPSKKPWWHPSKYFHKKPTLPLQPDPSPKTTDPTLSLPENSNPSPLTPKKNNEQIPPKSSKPTSHPSEWDPLEPPLRKTARATSTLPKEDPAQDEPILTPNERSYKQDIQQFTL